MACCFSTEISRLSFTHQEVGPKQDEWCVHTRHFSNEIGRLDT